MLYVGWRVTGDWWDPACLPRRNTLQKGNRNTSQTPGTRYGIFCTIIKDGWELAWSPPECTTLSLVAPRVFSGPRNARPELATGGALK